MAGFRASVLRLSGAAAFGTLALASLAIGSAPARATSDFRDVAVVSATINHVLENERSGIQVPWTNPDTGNSGYVEAERTYYIDDRIPCRDYHRSMTGSDGRTLLVTGTGCRNAEGRWKLDEATATSVATATPPEASVSDPWSEPGPASGARTEVEPAPSRGARPADSSEPSWSAGPAPEPPTPLYGDREETAGRGDTGAGRPEIPPTPARRPAAGSRVTTAATPGRVPGADSAEGASGALTVSLPTRSEG